MLVLAGSLALVLAGSAAAATAPHIVFILADDYGFNDISYHARRNGNDTNIIETPWARRFVGGTGFPKVPVGPERPQNCNMGHV